MKMLKKRFVLMAASASLTLTAAATTVFADTTGTTDITGGTLSVTAPTIATDFPGITLNGQVQTLNATLSNWSADDARGTGAGWNVTMQASQLTEETPSGGFASGTSAKTLPTGSLTLSGTRTVTAETGATPVDPTNGPVLQNQTTAIDVASPVKILDTQPNYGMGTYDITEPTNGLTLTLDPATTYVDTTNYASGATPYQTTITVTANSGP